jgi:hypothetical protein
VKEAAQQSGGRLDWQLILIFWIGIALLFIGRALLQEGTVPLLGDGDDAMRMVTATDLLGGQAWQDTIQHRDNTPGGSSMHWSRLIDAPVALLMALAAPLAGAEAPDTAAMAWPVLLLLPMMVLTALMVRHLVPDAGTITAIVLPVISMVVLIEFLPGRVDHHNIQIILSLAMLLPMLVARERWWSGLVTGLAVATSLAIGIETLPVIAVVVAAQAVLWVADPARYRPALIAFAGALAGGTWMHLIMATPLPQVLTPACDALSVTYTGAATIGAAGLPAVAILAARLSRPLRLLAMVVAGAASFGTVAALFPACIGGPYGDVPPDVMGVLFTDIAEAQTLFERLAADPATGIAFTSTALIGLGLTAWKAWRESGERRVSWLLVFAFLAATSVVMLLQIRGARLATPFAFPAAAWLITVARERYVKGRQLGQAAVLLGSWVLMSGVAQFGTLLALALATTPAVADAATDDATARRVCFLKETYMELAALPVGRVIAPYRIGPHILRYTPHAVVATGFHRNGMGVLDTVAFFAGDEAAARRIAADRGIDYVVTCPGAPIYEGAVGPSGGGTWEWLEQVKTTGSPLKLYRIRP